ncbi:hypothetical protein VNDN251_31140 [Mycobacterium tuberculosis]|nr:hypothetical protein VNDN181_31280 [Mycobacterium tuberculosis]BCR78617.1 hypothetical protein VNDN251_31140 [Mycobacterium tuberculosis]BCX23019.1 hypothetical protein MTR2092_31130 [Mycobacterium tuberculosis]
MGLMGPHPNAVALLVDPVADVVGEELGVWLAASLPAVVRGLNRPGMSGDSSSWKGWGHVRWFIEEVPAGAA